MKKKSCKKHCCKFLNSHYYFSNIWAHLPPYKKEKILTIIAEGKSVTPYEIIVDMKSFFIKPDGLFWEKSEFFSELKQKTVDDESYENSKYLYQTLKMRNLGDLNDLYNAQDVILLTEIIESRFQAMQNAYGFNSRKCNSASSMSGCIEREISKIILTLPTKYEHYEIFEQIVIGGFSSVNTRLAFDSEILLPNLIIPNVEKRKNLNYKVIYNLTLNVKKEKKENNN